MCGRAGPVDAGRSARRRIPADHAPPEGVVRPNRVPAVVPESESHVAGSRLPGFPVPDRCCQKPRAGAHSGRQGHAGSWPG